MSANTQYCWQHYITFPAVSQSFQFQPLYLNTKKVLVAQLKCQISLLGTPAKKFENPSSTI